MSSPSTFDSLPFSSSETVSWIHIGDLHMVRSGEQNEIDLGRIVDQINEIYAKGGVDFVFLPGDIADDGSQTAYKAVRAHLDRLRLPWCGIVGDHDVHEKSFQNFNTFIDTRLYSAFSIGPYRFLRLNAFSRPVPDSFTLDQEQLSWLDRELAEAEKAGQRAVLLLHCYPTDLKHGKDELKQLLERYNVLLIDMGHTHYNEVSNDGKLLYSATRSTGQVEEGSVGYSITTLDDNQVSWHFATLDAPEVAAITQPVDERFITERSGDAGKGDTVQVHVKVWSADKVNAIHATVADQKAELTSQDGIFWTGSLPIASLEDGIHEVRVEAQAGSKHLASSIRMRVGALPERTFHEVDQENSIGEWKERGLLDTQLGPNKNGKKW